MPISRVYNLAERELGHDLAIGRLLHQLSCRQHHDDVIMRMPVPPRFRAGREAPLRHDYTVGFLEKPGGCFGSGMSHTYSD